MPTSYLTPKRIVPHGFQVQVGRLVVFTILRQNGFQGRVQAKVLAILTDLLLTSLASTARQLAAFARLRRQSGGQGQHATDVVAALLGVLTQGDASGYPWASLTSFYEALPRVVYDQRCIDMDVDVEGKVDVEEGEKRDTSMDVDVTEGENTNANATMTMDVEEGENTNANATMTMTMNEDENTNANASRVDTDAASETDVDTQSTSYKLLPPTRRYPGAWAMEWQEFKLFVRTQVPVAAARLPPALRRRFYLNGVLTLPTASMQAALGPNLPSQVPAVRPMRYRRLPDAMRIRLAPVIREGTEGTEGDRTEGDRTEGDRTEGDTPGRSTQVGQDFVIPDYLLPLPNVVPMKSTIAGGDSDDTHPPPRLPKPYVWHETLTATAAPSRPPSPPTRAPTPGASSSWREGGGGGGDALRMTHIRGPMVKTLAAGGGTVVEEVVATLGPEVLVTHTPTTTIATTTSTTTTVEPPRRASLARHCPSTHRRTSPAAIAEGSGDALSSSSLGGEAVCAVAIAQRFDVDMHRHGEVLATLRPTCT